MHPLATRYVQSFQQLQARLRTVPSSIGKAPNSAKGPDSRPATAEQPPSALNEFQGRQDVQYLIGNYFHQPHGNHGDAYRPTLGEVSHIAGFEDEFANIEHLLLDSTGLMEGWNEP
jgi:hypothetical protein